MIKNNDINGTYSLMLRQIDRKKELASQSKPGYLERAKRKAKSIVRPLYNKMKN